jgi:ribonuclease HII
MSSLYNFDVDQLKAHGVKYVIGLDEAGRGPLAGPVMTAAVVLDLEDIIVGVNDSKQLNEKKREAIFPEIYRRAKFKKAVAVTIDAIAKYNIRNATIIGMEACVNDCPYLEESIVLVDGDLILKNVPLDKQRAVVKGDAKSASIAAASIIAKVARDDIMKKYALEYPEYLFEKHKGYGTKVHIDLIGKYGLSPIHRVSFCKKFVR